MTVHFHQTESKPYRVEATQLTVPDPTSGPSATRSFVSLNVTSGNDTLTLYFDNARALDNFVFQLQAQAQDLAVRT